MSVHDIIPCIIFKLPEEEIGFHMERQQFPVQHAFSMTINKSQGQSVKNVGLDLRHPVFTHGQFYVVASRCTSSECIKVLFPEGSECSVTTNIVQRMCYLKKAVMKVGLIFKLDSCAHSTVFRLRKKLTGDESQL